MFLNLFNFFLNQDDLFDIFENFRTNFCGFQQCLAVKPEFEMTEHLKISVVYGSSNTLHGLFQCLLCRILDNTFTTTKYIYHHQT